MSRGFKSLTKQRRREVATLGGLKASKLGVSHKFSKAEATKAGEKSGELKRLRFALEAAKRLIAMGFTPTDLASLNLTHEEFIFFGGAKRNRERYKKLAERIIEVKEKEIKVVPDIGMQ